MVSFGGTGETQYPRSRKPVVSEQHVRCCSDDWLRLCVYIAGTIPTELGELKGLTMLDLSNNSLEGEYSLK